MKGQGKFSHLTVHSELLYWGRWLFKISSCDPRVTFIICPHGSWHEGCLSHTVTSAVTVSILKWKLLNSEPWQEHYLRGPWVPSTVPDTS